VPFLADKGEDAAWCIINRTMNAVALHAMGRLEDASTQFEEAERMTKDRLPSFSRYYSTHNFWYCDLLLDQGREADVLQRAAETLVWFEQKRWLLLMALDHLSLGRAHLLGVQRGARGDLAQAAAHLKDSVDGLRRAGQQDHFPLGLLVRAALHTHTHAFALARKDLDEAHAIATRCGFRLHEADAHLGYARLAFAEGAPTAAHPHLARARAIIEETGYHRRDGELAALERMS
jgi:hypothetical protein